MAASKKSGLTAKQLQGIKQKLQERRSELVQDTQGWSNEDDVGSASGDEGDLASAATTADITFSTRAREVELLGAIDEAIEKIEKGTYGKCIECEEQIPVARLEALPFAELCIDCQEKVDEGGSLANANSDRFELT